MSRYLIRAVSAQALFVGALFALRDGGPGSLAALIAVASAALLVAIHALFRIAAEAAQRAKAVGQPRN